MPAVVLLFAGGEATLDGGCWCKSERLQTGANR